MVEEFAEDIQAAWTEHRRVSETACSAASTREEAAALNVAVSAGYASRSRGGIHDLIDVETALATAHTAADRLLATAAGNWADVETRDATRAKDTKDPE